MVTQTMPATCPDAHCDRSTHVRIHERDPQLDTDPHDDAPVREAVCVIHGKVTNE
jgi:hypothetical protein